MVCPQHPVTAVGNGESKFTNLGLCDAKMSRFNLQGRFPGNELSCGQKPNGRSRNSKLTGKRVLHAISLSNKSPANVA